MFSTHSISRLCTIFWSKISEKIRSFFCVTIFRRKSYASQQSVRGTTPFFIVDVFLTFFFRYTYCKKFEIIIFFTVPLAETIRHPPTTALRRQLGTTVFKNACAIIVTHIILWLPYNIISLSRYAYRRNCN